MSKLTFDDFDPFAVRTMQFSNYAAWRLRHNFIDTEHILLGLCLNLRSSTESFLKHCDIDTNAIVSQLRRTVSRGPMPVSKGKRPTRKNAMSVTRHALRIATDLSASAVSNDHLLLGMLHTRNSIARSVLVSSGLRYQSLIREIEED